MKTVYFVRHGQSEGNVGPIRQWSETKLTEIGQKQAKFVADRVSRLPADIIISSTTIRARETADFILEKKKIPIEYSDLFVEGRRSSEVSGKPKDSPEAIEIQRLIKENFHKGYKYSDEENFDDLKKRSLAMLNYLTSRPEDKIIVVSHGFILRIVMAVVVHGENLTGKECDDFIHSFEHENTGITVLSYEEKDQNWRVLIWNDHAHLGEPK